MSRDDMSDVVCANLLYCNSFWNDLRRMQLIVKKRNNVCL